MTTYQMRDGQSYNGLLAFESADGVLIQTGVASTVRLSESDIVSRQPSSLSFMPSGLLNGLQPQGFADLYAYLKTLQPTK
jgi:putative heme-binding domain-containing protein